MKLVVIGTGYVGLVTGCCLAEAGNQVICVDHDAHKLALLQSGRAPFHEPGLEEVLATQLRAGRLRFESSIGRAMPGAECAFLAVGTPPQHDGNANLENLLHCVQELSDTAFGDCLIIIKSTVPVGTADRIDALLNAARPGVEGRPQVRVASNPEFLAEGRALQDFRQPERIVIGTEDEHAAALLERLYKPFNKDGRRLLKMDRRSAEFAKYACNAMLAARISMVNELAGIAGGLGANMAQVLSVLRSDPRIGSAYLQPGVGYGGSCLPKDLQALIHLAHSVDEPAHMLHGVRKVNLQQVERMLHAIRRHFEGGLEGKRIAIWGLSFKPGTDDVRASPSLALIKKLVDEGALIQAYDPVANHAAQDALGTTRISVYDDALAACRQADALAVMTEWEEFKAQDMEAVAACLQGGAIFDGRGIYDATQLRAHGLAHYHVGSVRPLSGDFVQAMPQPADFPKRAEKWS